MNQKIVQEYCVKHGTQDFFLGEVWNSSLEYCGEALHCPCCFPEHPDNPAVIEVKEQEDIRDLNSCMAL